MFTLSIFLIVLSIMIYRGRTDLIHSYHQEKVKDKAAYGKAFGKALFAFALAPFVSGVVGLFVNPNVSITPVLVLAFGFIPGFCCILAVQRKYNKGF